MPFSRKLTPAALPAFTTIWLAARMEVWAGAIKVSRPTGLPSEVIETQVVFSARIVSVNVGGAFAARWCKGVEDGGATVLAGLEARRGDAEVGEGFGGTKLDFSVAEGAAEWLAIFGKLVDDGATGAEADARAEVASVEEFVGATAGV